MPIMDIFFATKCINNRQNKLVLQKNKTSVYLHLFKKISSFVWKAGFDVLYKCKVSNFVGKLRDL